MKTFLVCGFLCIVLGFTLQAQNKTFTIRGDFKHFSKNDMIVLFNRANGSFTIDTLDVHEGKFEYSGSCNGRENRMMMLMDRERQKAFNEKGKGKPVVMYGRFDLSFFVHPGANILLTGDARVFPFVNLKDDKNPINEDYISVKLMSKKEQQEINRLHYTTNEAIWNGDKEIAAVNKNRIQELSDTISARTALWIETHPDREYAAYLFLNSDLTWKSVDELRTQYNKFSTEVQASEYGRNLLSIIESRERVIPGAIAPDFTLTDVSTGKEISLSDYKGKYVIIDFWGSWCGPCRASHPHLREIYDRYKGEKFDILGIAADRKKEVIQKAVSEDHITWAQASMFEKREGQKAIDKLYAISAFPTKFLINPKGVIEAIYIGSSDGLDEKLKELFGK